LVIGLTCINHHGLLVFFIKLCKNCSKFQNSPLCM
jgi:hypothetical protein